MKRILLLFLVLVNCIVHAQLVINNTSQTPQQLVQSVVVGQGINVSNIKFNGSIVKGNTITDQLGLFSNGSSTSIGIDKGIILSTGNAVIAVGPNDRNLATLPTSDPFEGDPDLYTLSNNQLIKNVAILEFDFVPTGNKLSFNFVFASEEYPEFVNDSYNDTFGFFLSGPGITGIFSGGAKNIALIPSTTLPVSINNLNNGNTNSGPCEYCSYFVNNEGGATIQYDGFTKVLSANSDVQCGQTYHIKLAIANVGDNNYDSAVFIEGASFSSSGIDLGTDVKVCGASNYILKTGLNTTEIHEWKKDGVIIPNESGPNLQVAQSGTYTVKAFPFGLSCPVFDEIKVEFNTVKTPIISCGIQTVNSIQFNWEAVPDATAYSVFYQVENNAVVNVGVIGNSTTYKVNGLNPGESAFITVTPIGTPTECFTSGSQTCALMNCGVPTLIVAQGSNDENGCVFTPISEIIYSIGGGATSASIIAGNLPAGVTGNFSGTTFTISGTPTTSGTFNYTISTLGGCSPSAKLNGTIQVNTIPIFNSVQPICEGTTLTPLPSQSNNNIIGTWTPAFNNTATTEYTFTPDTGQCANSTKLTITIIPKTTPIFNFVSPICEGETLMPLPLRSINNINGTWTPVLNNTDTTEYTFTPDAGQCANSTKLTITIIPKTTPIFNFVSPICEGETLMPLPLRSINNINGTWTPALNNSVTTEYTFTPNAGQCANSTKLTIIIIPKTTPIFSFVTPICEGETITPLPLRSNNNINGTWAPALNNSATTEYTFTPNTGECANKSKLTIAVNSKPAPLLADGTLCIDKKSNTVIQSYIIDTKLEQSTYDFEWFLDGQIIINAVENTFEAIKKGTYSVLVTNKMTSCKSNISTAVVSETSSNSTVFEIKQTDAFKENANLTISNSTGTGTYLYQLDQGPFQNSNIFSEVSPGTHILRVVETNGCTDLSYKVIVIGFSKFFTPNEDGHNDTWNINGLINAYNPSIYIFDRYGKLLKQITNTMSGWDGTYNGNPMPADDYWFKIIYLEDGISKEFKSHFSLKR